MKLTHPNLHAIFLSAALPAHLRLFCFGLLAARLRAIPRFGVRKIEPFGPTFACLAQAATEPRFLVQTSGLEMAPSIGLF